MTDALAAYRRITVKIGSALLVDAATGRLRADWLHGLAEDVAGSPASTCHWSRARRRRAPGRSPSARPGRRR
jgi:hypothetical protein